MKSIIRSTSQLSGLRDTLRRDVTRGVDDPTIVDDFVAAVNEVVTAALADAVGETETHGWSIDVRWFRRTEPNVELYAEIRNVAGTPRSLVEAELSGRLVRRYAERIDFEERIGGSVITVRCRV